MSETPVPAVVPTGLAMRLPADAAAILHRVAYLTGRSKRDLVSEAIRKTYGPGADEEPE